MNENPVSQSAVSIYNQQDALDDFPVLKAFQQYIDAEQTKARKRTIVLCAFFGFLMLLVISFFSIMLHRVSDRNQQLNDKLLDYVMQDRNRQPTTIVQSPSAPVVQNDAALKAMTESLLALQKQIAERQTQREEPPQPKAEERDDSLDEEQLAMRQKLDSDAAKLKKATERLLAEKKKMEKEKEELRRREVELHRRRLYPEYYGEKKPQAQAAPAARPRPAATRPPAAEPAVRRPESGTRTPSKTIGGAIDYFSAYAEEEEETAMPQKEKAQKPEISDEELDELIDSLPKPRTVSSNAASAIAPERKTGENKSTAADFYTVSVDESTADWLIPTK